MYDYEVDREDRPFIFATLSGWILFLLYAACCAFCAWQGMMFSAVGGMTCLILIMRRLYSRGSMWIIALLTLAAIGFATVTLWEDDAMTFNFKSLLKLFEYNVFFAFFYSVLCLNKKSKILESLENGGMWKYLIYLLIGSATGILMMLYIEIVEIGLFILLLFTIMFRGQGGGAQSSRGSMQYIDIAGNYHSSETEADYANQKAQNRLIDENRRNNNR